MIIFKTIDEETREQTIYQKIVLLHCIGHTHRNGKKIFNKRKRSGEVNLDLLFSSKQKKIA